MRAIHLYYMPLSRPCGAGARSCGTVGQSDADLAEYVRALASVSPGVRVELRQVDLAVLSGPASSEPDIGKRGRADEKRAAASAGNEPAGSSAAGQAGRSAPGVAELFRQYGPAALPIVSTDDRVLAYGEPDPGRLARKVAHALKRPAQAQRTCSKIGD